MIFRATFRLVFLHTPFATKQNVPLLIISTTSYLLFIFTLSSFSTPCFSNFWRISPLRSWLKIYGIDPVTEGFTILKLFNVVNWSSFKNVFLRADDIAVVVSIFGFMIPVFSLAVCSINGSKLSRFNFYGVLSDTSIPSALYFCFIWTGVLKVDFAALG